jgi:hypothetical protein
MMRVGKQNADCHVQSCPEEQQCYANQYGTSSLLVHQYQNETETTCKFLMSS